MLLDEEFIDWLYEKLNSFLELAKEQNDELDNVVFAYNKKVRTLKSLILEIISIIDSIHIGKANKIIKIEERNAMIKEVCYIWSIICVDMWL